MSYKVKACYNVKFYFLLSLDMRDILRMFIQIKLTISNFCLESMGITPYGLIIYTRSNPPLGFTQANWPQLFPIKGFVLI